MLKALFFVVLAANIFLLVSSTDSSTDNDVKSSSSTSTSSSSSSSSFSSSSSTSSSSSSTASECEDEGNDDDDSTTCGGDPNARPGCGQYCGRRCSNYNKRPVACAAICRLNACDCKANFVFDDNIEKCVAPKECTPVCGTNEVYSSCTNGGCFGAKNCSEIGTPIRCVRIDPRNCIKGCMCKEGYLKNANGICVKEDQCNACGKNEYFSNCTNGGCFGAINCSEKGRPIKCVKLNPSACKKGCLCEKGYLRNKKGVCVPEDKCESGSIKCTKPNEVYEECPGTCPARTCAVDDRLIFCPKQPTIGDPNCKPPACRCASGYYRNDNGYCVTWDECHNNQTCPKNEVYDPCPAKCPFRTCGINDLLIDCIPSPQVGDPDCAPPACRCADGLFRNDKGLCVPWEDCPKCTNRNEVYDPCPALCPPRDCSVDERSIRCKAPPKLGDAECTPGCRCEDGYKKNIAGQCIPKDKCSNCTRPHEYYDPCPDNCPPQVCAAIYSRYSCPIQTANKTCVGSCRCEPGYYRNKRGECISTEDCLKCKGPNEYFSCGGACDNVCSNLSEQNQTSCPIRNIVCNKKCYCDEGFARDANNTCVPFADCKPEPTCGVNEQYSGCANGGCFGPRKCADIGKFGYVCVDLIEGACKGGCLCKEGFYRNDEDVCVPEKECKPQVCGVNEEYSGCANGGCFGPRKCADLGGPFICVDLIEGACKGGCLCKEGFYRNDEDVCVPEKECRGDCGSYEIFSNCTRGLCRNELCSQQADPTVCIALADYNCEKGCVCQQNYLRADNGSCIPADQCPKAPQCKGNEVFSSCTQAECRAVSCKDRNKPVACPSIAEGYCKKGCVCRPDYYRADNGTCVSESECDRITCPDGGVFNTCPPAECDAEYCPKDRNSPQSCRSTKNCGKPRCTCGFNQKRNRKTNKCIATRDCPPFKCGGPNEEYQSCPPVCPGQNCSDYINNSTCPKFRIGIVVPCQPQCRCKENYYRNSEGICVKGSQCIKEAPTGCGGDPNAVQITGCGSGCRRSCSNYQQNDLICPAVCRTGCDCKPDYVYDDNQQKCILPSECTQNNPEPVTKKPEPVTGKPDPTDNNENALKRFSDGVYNFTFSFLNELMKSNKDKSVAASPFSVTVPLAQLALRTKGSSNAELLRVLNIRKDEIPQVFREEQDSFKNLTNVVYNLAAAVFVNNKYLLNDDFVKDSKDIFEALVESVDFSKSAEAAAIINGFVEQSTNNRIKDLVTPDMLTSLTRIVLINAIYFKGLWKSQFNRNNTQDRDFYVNKDKTIQVPTMYLENKFRYINSPDADAQILEMPYKNEDFTCLFILPNNKYEDLAVTVSKLTPDNMNKAINNMRTEKVKVYLPKFKIETSTDLKEILQKLGVTGIFNENKPEIVDVLKEYEPLFVSAAKQKCFVEMNEEGSEAAAANAFVISTRSLPRPPVEEIKFVADHPFVFMIRLNETILFVGAFIN